jgi:hypothetical protein
MKPSEIKIPKNFVLNRGAVANLKDALLNFNANLIED